MPGCTKETGNIAAVLVSHSEEEPIMVVKTLASGTVVLASSLSITQLNINFICHCTYTMYVMLAK